MNQLVLKPHAASKRTPGGWEKIWRIPSARISLLFLATVVLLAISSTVYLPHDPLALNIDARMQAPSGSHWLGTDFFGRDLLSRMLVGAGVSLRVSLFSVVFATVLGTLVGTLAGYRGGWTDRSLMVVVDAILAMPGILLALVLMMIIGAGEVGVVLALGLAYAPTVARTVRGTVLSIREKEFIEASSVLGGSDPHIMWRHVVPNTVGPLTVLCSSLFAQALLSESALSFLGLGVPPPYPSWGGMLADGRQFISQAPWLCLIPGTAITLTLLAINLLGDALRDCFDPRESEHR
ncbi:MAG TPA: peptide ABC transporter permease [Spongiibacteraceae bacterium]|nr:peptide ABC transporter permease [Spongiibacteraceae bacterium]MBN51636.1 peptide ABC transporter permease [Spongiibacteraceae bacterium]HCS28570.1 peptide ABC transporter permease [Spongiibacteraceae bacterium]